MNKKKNVSNNEAETSDIDNEIRHSILKSVIPQIIVNYNLDDLYIKNEKRAMKKVLIILKDEQPITEEKTFIVFDFREERKKLLVRVKNINDERSELIMILFYGVFLFESMVNEHIHTELTSKYGFNRKEVSDIIYRLSTDAKLGWFLKIINGKNYTKTKNWDILKKFIHARNFFIHYKPDTGERFDNHDNLLNVHSIKSFLDAANNCYSYLKKSRSEETKKFFDRVEEIKNIYDERNKS